MAKTPLFYDHFAEANMSVQERLGRSGATLNRDSAVFGQQTRSFVQMLNYGLDAMTARAASHLVNSDILYSNFAYLLKQCEGMLLNSVVSITPPRIQASTPFRFWSDRTYSRWSSLGTVSLKDGSRVSLIAYRISATGNVEGTDNGVEYEALYCAGNYTEQRIDSGFDGYTPGVFCPLLVSETYKSVWSESVEARVYMDDGSDIPLVLAWSLDELLGMPDNSNAALVMNTARGLTLTLGDGEIFGSGYNYTDENRANISSVVISYVKCDSLAPVDHPSVKFNSDITELNDIDGRPLLSVMGSGDTAASLRSRAVAEFFAASKITDERDLVTEVQKIPYVKSCSARREYNWPVWTTLQRLYVGSTAAAGTPERLFYDRYAYNASKMYKPGEMVAYMDALWIRSVPDVKGRPSPSTGWVRFMSLSDGNAIGTMYSRYYPSANVYDNATIVLSGLVLRTRRYWQEASSYSRGDVVYHEGTDQLWVALRDNGQLVEPGSEESTSFYDESGSVQRYWISRDEVEILESESGNTSDPYSGLSSKFDDYEQITQSIFEAELKGYYNIAGKLGFTSVVVEPLAQVGVFVSCKYKAPSHMQQQLYSYIQDYVCYNVHKVLNAHDLNAQLTEKFNLASVGVSLRLKVDDAVDSAVVELPEATYVPPSMLEIDLQEVK